MSKIKKLPAVPSMIPRKYHHEIKCVYSQFQKDIICDILEHAGLDDESFVKVSLFGRWGETPTGVLNVIKDVPGNKVSKRLFEIRTRDQEIL